ncbi:BppU family phage baseplate upper protein [Enterococcus faecium]|uniref:BppU family phage baseplate upper protein n=1 Tax=Enterococcus faecium TaxID=1352 RepID=UPI0014324CFB|nr:BppU family phage baseplate upper protein [Enterococcus faecium]QIT59651.1 BppU family phage baseplate upper protein [Enterococcus faecium]QIT62034.1 BppU family phage baseplate upper protein [Enterococcus faecium]
MADRKVGEITVPTEPVSLATKITGFTFKSYDKNAGVLQFNIENQDGSPTDLIDATVRLFMYIYQGEEKKEFPIFDNQIITESYMQGVVKYPIPDMLLSYEGKVDANVYIDFPDGSHTDNLAFTFNIEKSVIDNNVQLNGEYYFKDFQQLLDGVKQEATDAVNAALTNVDSTIEKANQQINEFVEGATQAIDQTVDEVTEQLQATQTKIDTVSQNVTSAQNNLKAVEDKMNQTNQQIGDLGKLKKMYSNSIDFGDYDYSGNPNLFRNIGYEDLSSEFTRYIKPSNVTFNSSENAYEIDITKLTANQSYYFIDIPRGVTGKRYTYSLSAKADVATGGIAIRPVVYVGTSLSVLTPSAVASLTNEMKRYTLQTNPLTDVQVNSQVQALQIYITKAQVTATKIYIKRDIKLEEGTASTPYQPNLLDYPYWLGKAPLGDNLITGTFPVSNSQYAILGRVLKKNLEIGKTYTATLKGTKPTTQTFAAYSGGTVKLGDFKPVEGLTDVWSVTFTVSNLSNSPANFTLYQQPQATIGACQIDWLKIEKGDTRTPNISQFKYFGEGLKDSNNPNDYSWDITAEYTEKGLNDTVSLTEPQSVEGLKNFEDGLQIAGKEVATVPEDTGWVNLTAINGHSWNKQGQIRRIGKLVMFRGSLKGSTLSTQDFCTIPEGFRPSNPTDNYEYQFLLPPQSSNTLDNGGMAYIRPNGVCGLPSFRGTANLFLAPIQYYID